ncbi:MAG: hypothetical protein IT160_19225 [Bryobacterales bacterium]|nr:hypothetical protein [Bryobacterales bacterium]
MTPPVLPEGFWMNEPLTGRDNYQRRLSNISCHIRSPFQEIYVAEAGAYGKALILNGQLQAAAADEFLYHEALVHPAMIRVRSPRKVLIIGGGEGAAAREVLRWRDVERVVIVEIDREVVAASRRYLSEIHQHIFDDLRVQVVFAEGRRFLQTTEETWDVIIFDLPDPAEDAPWWPLYAKDSFRNAARRLSTDGSFVLQAGPISPLNLADLRRIVINAGATFPCLHVYTTFVPSFGIPLAFVLASFRAFTTRPSPEVVDRVLAEKVRSRLRMLDGAAFLGLMQAPVYLREAMPAGLGLTSPAIETAHPPAVAAG